MDKTENGKAFKQLSHVVSEERISAGGESLTTRTYTTDKLGRVTGIADSKFGNHSYEYDCRGFLVKDGNTAYEYDANGNVTKIGNTVLEYDCVVKDKLVKVGGKVVAYDANNPLVPTSYDGNIIMQYSQKNNFNFAINPYRFGAIAERFRPPPKYNTFCMVFFVYFLFVFHRYMAIFGR